MLKKRVVGVITVNNGLAVQSFKYSRYLPIGNPLHLVDNLDRWGVDEILVLDICRSKKGLGPNIELLKTISSSSVNTPLIYGGGIRTAEDAIAVIHSGADRVVIDNILHQVPRVVADISRILGTQAVITSFPVSIRNDNSIVWYDHVQNSDVFLNEALLKFLRQDLVSEILLIDRDHDGIQGTFERSLVDHFPLKIPMIIFGGVSTEHDLESFIEHPRVAAVAFGNTLNYSELSIQRIKSQFVKQHFRKAHYSLERR